jgi:hypothetical protein
MHNSEGMFLLLEVKDSKNNRPFSTIPDGLPNCAGQKEPDVYPWLQTPAKKGDLIIFLN